MCARVCPTESLCEAVCVRTTQEGKPVAIGRLQRHAVVVIGGGMTAVDAATQAKLLGAQDVHIVYRRGPGDMSASSAKQAWAQTNGVTIHHWLAPVAIEGSDGHASAVRFARQAVVNGQLTPTGELETLAADMVLKAILTRA